MHGYLSKKESFLYQVNYLSEYYRVIAVDLTGFGESGPITHAYSLDDYIEDVKSILKELGIERCHVIAHSFGGRIALKTAAFPNCFDKLILTGCAGLKPKRRLKYYVKVYTYKFLKRFIAKDRLEKRFGSSDYRQLSPLMKESFKLIVNEHLDGYLKDIENKTLLIFGKDDKETPPYMAKRLNKGIKNSELVTIKGGHFCFVDDHDSFNIIAKYFLDS